MRDVRDNSQGNSFSHAINPQENQYNYGFKNRISNNDGHGKNGYNYTFNYRSQGPLINQNSNRYSYQTPG